jgi:hypothetical protein
MWFVWLLLGMIIGVSLGLWRSKQDGIADTLILRADVPENMLNEVKQTIREAQAILELQMELLEEEAKEADKDLGAKS